MKQTNPIDKGLEDRPKQLSYCSTHNQMTWHLDSECLNCKLKGV